MREPPLLTVLVFVAYAAILCAVVRPSMLVDAAKGVAMVAPSVSIQP